MFSQQGETPGWKYHCTLATEPFTQQGSAHPASSQLGDAEQGTGSVVDDCSHQRPVRARRGAGAELSATVCACTGGFPGSSSCLPCCSHTACKYLLAWGA